MNAGFMHVMLSAFVHNSNLRSAAHAEEEALGKMSMLSVVLPCFLAFEAVVYIPDQHGAGAWSSRGVASLPMRKY